MRKCFSLSHPWPFIHSFIQKTFTECSLWAAGCCTRSGIQTEEGREGQRGSSCKEGRQRTSGRAVGSAGRRTESAATVGRWPGQRPGQLDLLPRAEWTGRQQPAPWLVGLGAREGWGSGRLIPPAPRVVIAQDLRSSRCDQDPEIISTRRSEVSDRKSRVWGGWAPNSLDNKSFR